MGIYRGHLYNQTTLELLSKKKILRDFLEEPSVCLRNQWEYTWIWRFLKGGGGLLENPVLAWWLETVVTVIDRKKNKSPFHTPSIHGMQGKKRTLVVQWRLEEADTGSDNTVSHVGRHRASWILEEPLSIERLGRTSVCHLMSRHISKGHEHLD